MEKDTGAELKLFGVRIQAKMPDAHFKEMLSLVDEKKQQKILRFLHWQDAYRALFSDILVRAILIKHWKFRNTEILFSYGEFGKPMLTNSNGIHFNVSHSGEMIVAAFDKMNVGIDVEQVGDIDLSLSANYFSPEEHFEIINFKNPQDKFFEYWTLKESYIKFTGRGLSEHLDSFKIAIQPKNEILVIKEGKLLENVFFKQFNWDPQYKIALCSERSRFSGDCVFYSINELVKIIKTVG